MTATPTVASTPTDSVESTFAKYLAKQAMEETSVPEQYKRAPKVYFHRHNYANFIFDFKPWGSETVKKVSFANYKYITEDIREQEQLDMVANKNGTMIYTASEAEMRSMLDNQMLQEMRQQTIMQTAAAVAGSRNQQFDANVPIQAVAHETPTIQFVPQATQGIGHVGIQSSLAGTASVEVPTSLALTSPADQTAPPTAVAGANASLLAALNAVKSAA